ncbi:MAG: PF20097 family protein [Enterocloster bolteae]
MKCPYCNQEMEAGFLTSDARCIAWRRERHEPGLVSRNDRNSGVQLARKTLGQR